MCDPALADQHLTVHVGASGASLIAHAAGTNLGQREIGLGKPAPLSDGAEIRVGQSVIRLHAPRRPVSVWPSPIALWGAFVLALAVAISTFVLASPRVAIGRARVAAAKPPSGAAAAAADLARHLRAGGPRDSIVVVVADNAVVAAGDVPLGGMSKWRDAASWFDSRYGNRVALIDKTTAASAADTPDLDIAAISLFPVANILTRSGEHLTEGAVLQSGWCIVAISVHEVRLRRGARTVVVTI
jgi:hypothetical protein